jgi:hypothetical protein
MVLHNNSVVLVLLMLQNEKSGISPAEIEFVVNKSGTG